MCCWLQNQAVDRVVDQAAFSLKASVLSLVFSGITLSRVIPSVLHCNDSCGTAAVHCGTGAALTMSAKVMSSVEP